MLCKKEIMVRRSRMMRLDKLDEVYEKVKLLFAWDRITAIEKQGKYLLLWKERMGTLWWKEKNALIQFERWCYKCGIEKVYYDGKSNGKNQFPVTFTLSELQKIKKQELKYWIMTGGDLQSRM